MPADIIRKTESWFARHRRALPWRDGYDPYQVWVSEVMAQQTRIEVVLGYFDRFVERFPSIAALAQASDDQVTAAWSGLGYYRRARMLRDGAAAVVERFGGKVPKAVAELRTLPGIGRYTAGAIASIAYDVAAPIVDGNVARILARLFAIEEPVGSAALMRAAWTHAEEMAGRAKSPRNFNQGLMEIGALVCKPRNPLCLTCPLQRDCAARRAGRANEMPLPKPKAATRAMRIPLFLVTDGAGRLLMRRESGPLMNALFHLPHGDSALFGSTPLAVERQERLGAFRHTVTNRRIEFEVFAANLCHRKPVRFARRGLAMTDGYEWIAPADLAAVPHPSYVRKALRIAGIEKTGGQFFTA